MNSQNPVALLSMRLSAMVSLIRDPCKMGIYATVIIIYLLKMFV
jgi:hypothetical protein